MKWPLHVQKTSSTRRMVLLDLRTSSCLIINVYTVSKTNQPSCTRRCGLKLRAFKMRHAAGAGAVTSFTMMSKPKRCSFSTNVSRVAWVSLVQNRNFRPEAFILPKWNGEVLNQSGTTFKGMFSQNPWIAVQVSEREERNILEN